MMPDPLSDALQALLVALEPNPPAMVVVGGYGLVLKAEQLRASGARTRIADLPIIRATADIDWLLTSEIITDPDATRRIRSALDTLGYRSTVDYWQFAREVDGDGGRIKFDFLGFAGDGADVHLHGGRVRARGFRGLHGRLALEAFAVGETRIRVELHHASARAVTYVPHPFAYLILKLFALRDRLGEADADDAKYHALDIYKIWAMMTEPEWNEAVELKIRYAGHPLMPEVGRLIALLFRDISAPGIAALISESAVLNVFLARDRILAFVHDLQTLLG
jgi:hypothetical protein